MPTLSVSRIRGEYNAKRGQRRGYRNRQKPDHGELSEKSDSWSTCDTFSGLTTDNLKALLTKHPGGSCFTLKPHLACSSAVQSLNKVAVKDSDPTGQTCSLHTCIPRPCTFILRFLYMKPWALVLFRCLWREAFLLEVLEDTFPHSQSTQAQTQGS